MHPNTTDVMTLFEKGKRYLVPIFQRNYVWTMDGQWKYLWSDISSKANEILDKGPNTKIRKHFLGAIVLFFYEPSHFSPHIVADEIIDGQQRITTLQIILAALRDFAKMFPSGTLFDELEVLTCNKFAKVDKENYKVWPSVDDRTVFENVFLAGGPVRVLKQYPQTKKWRSRYFLDRHKLVNAYLYFFFNLAEFVFEDGNGKPIVLENQSALDERVKNLIGLGGKLTSKQEARLQAVFDAVTKYMEIVEIGLEKDDDPQVIFEALNDHREPLKPSDLVRNFVFLRAQSSGSSIEDIHRRYWAEYDDSKKSGTFWKAVDERGRRSDYIRFDIFVFNYLVMQMKKEVSLGNLYQDFREWWDSSPSRDLITELENLNTYSDLFKSFYSPDTTTQTGLFLQRVRDLGTSVVYPLVLFILGQSRDTVSDGEKAQIFKILESYLIRRAVCGLTAKNYNRFFLSLLRGLSREDKITSVWVSDYLQKQTEDTSRWPTDDEFKAAWLERPIYSQNYALPRLLLKALDLELASSKRIVVKIDGEVSVEHIMPQNHLKAAGWALLVPHNTDELGKIRLVERRNRLIHTLGNLTLVTTPLNASMQDAPFSQKRGEILKHNSIQLNNYFLDFKNDDEWNEEKILDRGQSLLNTAKTIWFR